MREDLFSRINEDPLPPSLSFNLEKSNNSSPTDVCLVSSKKGNGPRKKERGIYERSLSRLQDRALKIKSIEQQMMEECTFSPSINPSTTLGNESRVAVWKRLYPDKNYITTQKSNSNSLRDTGKKSMTPRSVDTNSTDSSRIQRLYQEGVKKSTSRAARTDKEENIIRQQRHEDLKLRNCTFKPTMRWTVKTLSPKKRLSPLRSKNLKSLTAERTPGTLSSVFNVQAKGTTIRSTEETLSNKKRPMPLQSKNMISSSSAPECISKTLSSVTEEGNLSDKFEGKEAHEPPLKVLDSSKSSFTFAFDCKIDMVAVSPLREPSFSDTSQSSSNSLASSIESIIEYGSI